MRYLPILLVATLHTSSWSCVGSLDRGAPLNHADDTAVEVTITEDSGSADTGEPTDTDPDDDTTDDPVTADTDTTDTDAADTATDTTETDTADTPPDLCALDTDEDGTVDCEDACPTDPDKTDPGVCGCGESDADSDLDGAADCHDLCPTDHDKTDPGLCGCGVSERDSDLDGVPNCNDTCPIDPNKSAPGECGCGFPEASPCAECSAPSTDNDQDGDGVPDCIDRCADADDAVDVDLDGYADACDCEPTQSATHPEALEICDRVDNDCDGLVDDITGTWMRSFTALNHAWQDDARYWSESTPDAASRYGVVDVVIEVSWLQYVDRVFSLPRGSYFIDTRIGGGTITAALTLEITSPTGCAPSASLVWNASAQPSSGEWAVSPALLVEVHSDACPLWINYSALDGSLKRGYRFDWVRARPACEDATTACPVLGGDAGSCVDAVCVYDACR